MSQIRRISQRLRSFLDHPLTVLAVATALVWMLFFHN